MSFWPTPSRHIASRPHAAWARAALAGAPDHVRDAALALPSGELERHLVESAFTAAEVFAAELAREREYQRGSIRGVTMHGLAQRYGQLLRETRDLYETGHDRAEVYEILTKLRQALMQSLDRHHHAYYAELQRTTGQDRLVRALERAMEAKE